MKTTLHSHSPLRIAITGGTSGLGLALVEALRTRGDAVAIDARVARDDARCLGFEYHEPQTVPPAPL